MNKNTIFISVSILLLAIIGGAVFYLNEQNKDESNLTPLANQLNDITLNANEDNLGAETQNTTMAEAPETAIVYTIENGSFQYEAQKLWISKPTEKVTATTTFDGNGWFDVATQSGYLFATVDVRNFLSNEEDRDSEVTKLFNSDAVIVFSQDNLDINLNENFSLSLPAEVTLNGITRVIPLGLSGTVSETEISVTGQARINMNDFGITPPTFLGVYNVDEFIDLTFELNGTGIVNEGN